MADTARQWIEKIANGTGADLLRYLRARLSNANDAEDLAQEVYMRLLRVKDPGLIQHPRAYLLRVAANVAYEHQMLARNRLQHSSETLEKLASSSDPEHEAEITQQIETLTSALNSVSPKCRAVVLMHRRERWTYQEIAVHMDISVSMVKKYLVKGLTVCQQRLIKTATAEKSDG